MSEGSENSPLLGVERVSVSVVSQWLIFLVDISPRAAGVQWTGTTGQLMYIRRNLTNLTARLAHGTSASGRDFEGKNQRT